MRHALPLALAALLAAHAGSAGAAQSPTVAVDRAEVRASLGTTPTTAAYMTLRNTGPAADRLVGASCDCAASVSLHQTVRVGGVARMAPEPAVTVPAGGEVAFAPGGRHIMLMGLKAPIRAGATVPIVLRFERAGALTVQFKATDRPGEMAQHRH